MKVKVIRFDLVYIVPTSFLFLVVRPLLLVAMPFAPSSVLAPTLSMVLGSWSLSCFSKEGGSRGPECRYLIYQALTPPPAGSTPPFSSVPAAAWSLAACMLGAADCLWLLAGCC